MASSKSASARVFVLSSSVRLGGSDGSTGGSSGRGAYSVGIEDGSVVDEAMPFYPGGDESSKDVECRM